MLLLLSAALADDVGLHPATVALARAVQAYTAGERGDAVERLEALTVARPWDDDAHWWLARAYVDAGRFEQAVSHLAGREGRGVPAGEFRALEGIARLASGDAGGAELVVGALAGLREGALKREALAVLGVHLAAEGEDRRASGALHAAGGDPLLVLSSELAGALPGAAEVLAVDVSRGAPEGAVVVARGGQSWRVDLETGLARKVDRSAPEQGRYGPKVACMGGEVWTLGTGRSGLAGVYRSSGLDELRVARTPLGATDYSPSCSDESVYFARRIGELEQLVRVRDGDREELRWEHGLLASVQARDDDELLVGAVIDGQPVAYHLSGLEGVPTVLWESALSFGVPRW